MNICPTKSCKSLRFCIGKRYRIVSLDPNSFDFDGYRLEPLDHAEERHRRNNILCQLSVDANLKKEPRMKFRRRGSVLFPRCTGYMLVVNK